MVIPDRTPRNAGLVARVHRRTTRRVITAQTHRLDTNTVHVNVAARLEIIECGTAGHFEIMPQIMSTETDRLALPRTIHQQTGETATRQIGNTAQILNFFLRIEAAKAHHAGIARSAGVFSMHKVSRERTAGKRQLDALDARAVVVFDETGKTVE